MIHRIEVADYTDGAEQGTEKEAHLGGAGKGNRLMVFSQHDHRNHNCHQIPEKYLLHGRNIAAEPDKHAHQRKEKCRGQNTQNSLVS